VYRTPTSGHATCLPHGGSGGDSGDWGVCGVCLGCCSVTAHFTITTEATTKYWANLSIVAKTSNWPDRHQTISTDWTTSDLQSSWSSSLLPVSGAATLSNSSRICVHPVTSCHRRPLDCIPRPQSNNVRRLVVRYTNLHNNSRPTDSRRCHRVLRPRPSCRDHRRRR